MVAKKRSAACPSALLVLAKLSVIWRSSSADRSVSRLESRTRMIVSETFCVPRAASDTLRIFSSAQNLHRVFRRTSFTCFSAISCGPDFCIILAPLAGYDGPEILLKQFRRYVSWLLTGIWSNKPKRDQKGGNAPAGDREHRACASYPFRRDSLPDYQRCKTVRCQREVPGDGPYTSSSMSFCGLVWHASTNPASTSF